MADKEIMFTEADGYLKATIDNQELELPVKEIVKQETNIVIDENNIDITLQDNIHFTGFIDTIASMRDLLISGILYITIQDENLNTLIKTTVPFSKRNFEVDIPNSFPVGHYYCKIEYIESKYFLGCQYTIAFEITKRMIGYKFDKSVYSAYPNQEVDIQMYLYDYKNKTPIQTNVLYKFDEQEFSGKTDSDGYINMSVITPDVVKENCKGFMQEIVEEEIEESPDVDLQVPYNTLDTRGWVYQNGKLIQWFDSAYHYYVGQTGINAIKMKEEFNDIFQNEQKFYSLDIEIQDDTYTTYPISLRIYIQKSPTVVNWNESQEIDGEIRISGNVEGATGPVKYGSLIFNCTDKAENIKIYVDEYGDFVYYFNPLGIGANLDNKLEHYIEQTKNIEKVDTQIKFNINSETYNVRNKATLIGTAEISAIQNGTLDLLKEGMICFIIYRKRYDNDAKKFKWVRNYRYSEEITDDGKAEIHFDLSSPGEYYIYAEYYGMLEFKDATSDKIYYEVIDEI